MRRSASPRFLVGFAALVGMLVASWLALTYFLPAPPSKIVMATSTGESSDELLANRYRAILSRSHVDLDILRANSATEILQLLQNKSSGVVAAIIAGGASDAALSSDLRSLGRVNYQPYWVFYRSENVWTDLPDLKGKRIAVGPVDSDNRILAQKLFKLSGFGPETVEVPLVGQAAVQALAVGGVDAVFIAGAPDTPNIQTLLRDPAVRVMNFPRADALSRIFPYLVHLTLPAGAVDFAKNIPPADLNLIGTTNAVLVRDDLHPQIVYLLTQALMQIHNDASLLRTAGEFPTQRDPEYLMADAARDLYRNGPTFLNRYLPFWAANYIRRVAAMLVASIAVILPAFGYTPRLYAWFREQRLRTLYRRLRVIEHTLEQEPFSGDVEVLQQELDEIDRATRILPMGDSDLFFMFRQHLELTRSRLQRLLSKNEEEQI
jgi:TRAP-type uncharacterized transport system substrate-binding protein